MKEIEQLIAISRYYGADKRYVIAGGGNTSYKNDEKLWIKASGSELSSITEDGFAVLCRYRLNLMSEKSYSADPVEREEQIKNDLADATLTKGKRPSVETSMHNAIRYAFVVHLHPTAVNALMCSQDVEEELERLFGERALYIPYTDPGYVLFRKVDGEITSYRTRYGEEPKVIWLQNHGIFVAADTVEEIRAIYGSIIEKLDSRTGQIPDGVIPDTEKISEIIPAIRMLLSSDSLKTLKVRNNALVRHFSEDPRNQRCIETPFTPDAIVYCSSCYLFINEEGPEIIETAKRLIIEYGNRHGHMPKILMIKGIGLIAAGDNAVQANTVLDVFEDAMKIAYLSRFFGGCHPMTRAQIDFIDNWEVENYRRKVAMGTNSGRAEGKTIIITGAAQGIGEGVARNLSLHGANIVIADLNETAGRTIVESLNRTAGGNRAIFVGTDVSDISSIENLVNETVGNFGAIDCLICNAGVLRAGNLEDMTPEAFEFVTRINYSAYFYCLKVVTPVMKLQTKHSTSDYYADVIQVNSKSGIRGSRANFAYSGSKFGGIGLTQSFALELAPFGIKVNSICPGNFYEGPLWSNPENGLFVQYLRAGKVPGAKTVEDVKDFYLSQVPMGKGCSPGDITKAVLYLMEQNCETGQALPITGGQVMLS
ncbi:MAG: SDR family NAD(P)-dependent oxidoreductase [Dysgonamonadaceae bacterium]|jgi:NAD(P)-dependent dehydrogenase (short-subunit alcohol dehydrogenase family)/rhamnose utilization protein RhaD (predicted bifunctional aldolase and dehydrogenase)|nr:SDR family NAD(P)-dependent oxidoreductase [Dysgonamonadaceae bacterium]